MRLIELFAGVGSQTQALKNIGVEHEVIGISEIDKFAIASYEALHGPTHNFGDISGIPKLPEADLWTYSFPCQDLSVAGKQAGLQGKRSGLLYEVERLLTTSPKPKYLLMENVKNLVGKQHRADFEDWIARLEEFGYVNFWQVLNAKDYGIPQNRERVFMISILGKGNYTFPETQLLTLRLRDMLDDVVDDKYYLNVSYTPKQTSKSTDVKVIGELDIKDNERQRRLYDNKGISPSLLARNDSPKIMVVANTNSKHEHSGRVYDPDGLSPTIMSNSHGKTNGGYTSPKVALGIAQRGREHGQQFELNGGEFANALTTVQKDSMVYNGYQIRKLTPKECWRLMGFTDEQFDKVSFQSNTQLYKQAGNSIVVPVLEALFKELI
jgi:DNA (cytosine-5)-methyltransferase 1